MPTVTLAQLKAQTLTRLENNSRAFGAVQLTTVINEGIQVLNMHCGWVSQTIDLGPTVSNRPIYNIPEQIIYPTRVYFEGRVLYKTTLRDLLDLHPSALIENTSQRYGSVEQWCSIGSSKAFIWPAASVAGQSLQVTGVVEPTTLTTDASVIQLPNEAASAIADYAAHRVQFKIGGVPFNQSIAYYANFQTFMKSRTAWRNLDFPGWKIARQVQPSQS